MLFQKLDIRKWNEIPLWLLWIGLICSSSLLIIGVLLLLSAVFENLSVPDFISVLASVLFFALCAYGTFQSISKKISKK